MLLPRAHVPELHCSDHSNLITTTPRCSITVDIGLSLLAGSTVPLSNYTSTFIYITADRGDGKLNVDVFLE